MKDYRGIYAGVLLRTAGLVGAAGLLGAATLLCQVSAFAQAADKGEKEAAGEASPEAAEAPAGEAKEGEEAAAGGEEGAAAGEEGAAPEGEEEEEEAPPTDEGGLASICKLDPEACPKLDLKKEAGRQIREPLFAVQQIFVLRVRRLEVSPFWSFSLNDQFVSHPGPGVGLNYWITNVLAVGVNGNYYQPFNSDSLFNFQTRRAARVNVPLTEYQWGAALNFTYAPIMGKFSGFGDFIFQYDAYVVGGVGLLSSRPIPVVDPDVRDFSFEPQLAFNAGIGIHIFFNRWFAGTLELRDYIFSDRLENTEPPSLTNAEDSSTWLGDKKLTNNVQAQLGVSFFVPFSFEYRLPK